MIIAFPSLIDISENYITSRCYEVQNYLRLSASICVQLLLLVPHLNGNVYIAGKTCTEIGRCMPAAQHPTRLILTKRQGVSGNVCTLLSGLRTTRIFRLCPDLLLETKGFPISGIPLLSIYSLADGFKGSILSIVPSTPNVKLYSKV